MRSGIIQVALNEVFVLAAMMKHRLYQWKTLFNSPFIVFKISTLLVHVSADHPHIGGQKSSSCIANEFHDLWKTSAIPQSSQQFVQYFGVQPHIHCSGRRGSTHCWSRLKPRATTQQWSWASVASGLLLFLIYDVKIYNINLFWHQKRYVTIHTQVCHWCCHGGGSEGTGAYGWYCPGIGDCTGNVVFWEQKNQ